MVGQVVLFLVIILTACNHQALVNGNKPCKIPNVGGLVCVSYSTKLYDGSAYAFKHLSCAQTDKQGQKKLLMKEKPEQIVYNPGHFLMTTKKGKLQALRQGGIFRRIKMLVVKSCLNQSEDAVVYTSRGISAKTVAGKGYRKLEFGKDTMYIKRYDITRSWDEAANVCLSENARLAKIDTEQKMKEIKAKVSKPGDQFKMFYMWIGLRDFDRNNSFTWIDGNPLMFAQWYSDEPSNTVSLSNSTVVDEDCVALVNYVFVGLHFSDRICGDKHGFICEINQM